MKTRIIMTRKQFKEMYFSRTLKDMARLLSISTKTIQRHAKSLGLSKGIAANKKIIIKEEK